MKPLAGNVALVTGAGRGVGRDRVRLARDGARLVAHYSGSRAGAEEVAEAVSRAGGEAFAYQADIAKR